MGRELQMPQRDIKIHRFHVERREFEGVFPSFFILFSGGKKCHKKEYTGSKQRGAQHKMGQLCPPKEIHLRALLETQEGLFRAGIPQTHRYTFSKFTPSIAPLQSKTVARI